MKYLVSFYLKRKFKEPVTIILNVLVCVLLVVLCNIDLLFDINIGEVKVVKLDSTTKDLYSYLKNNETFYYDISDTENKENEAILHFDEKYILITDNKVSDEILEILNNDLKKALKEQFKETIDNKTAYYLDLFDERVENIVEEEKSDDLIWIISSIVYFLIITYGSLISNDIVYEKNSRILELQFTCIDAKEHFKAKFMTGYLSLIIQFAIIIFALIIGISIRYRLDGFSGIINMVENETYQFEIDWLNIVLLLALLVVGMLIIQIVLLLICSNCTNSEQSSTINSLFYIFSLAIYYYLLTSNSIDLYANLSYLTYFPVINMYFTPVRLLTNMADYMEAVVSLIISSIFLYILIEVSMPLYRKNLIKK